MVEAIRCQRGNGGTFVPGGCGCGARRRSSGGRGTRFASVVRRHVLELALAGQALRDRLLREAADVGAGGRDVEQRALDGGDAEAVALRDLVGGEGEAVEAQL